MAAVIDLIAFKGERLHREPSAEVAYGLSVMPLALDDDQPLSDRMYTLPDGRVVQAYASEKHQQQYLVGVHPVQLDNLERK